MFADYLRRGLAAGFAGGLAYAAFVGFVGNPLVAFAESLEGAPAGDATVAAASTAWVSAVAALLWGALLGVLVLGVGYYLLEPIVPGRADTRGYLLSGAGFVAVSGAPWLVLPPQPPGVEQALPTDARLLWFAAMVVLGAGACVAGFLAADRLRDRGRAVAVAGGIAPLALLAMGPLLAPANPTTGPIPAAFMAAFRWTTVLGQVLLWVAAAAAFAWLERRAGPHEG